MDEELVFSTSRVFEMWFYSASHNRLLLRSNKLMSSGVSSRVEVLFGGVASLCVPSAFRGLSVHTVDDVAELDCPVPLGQQSLKGKELYVLQGISFIGYVAADWLRWSEDELGYSDASSLLKDVGIARSVLQRGQADAGA